ncbi:glucose-6-phosphate dehydrogenase assembly protein OpcA [Tersicoccus solisilvae]|uniref:Glucose-6-phosphate dehydrogenase assembly protein OpcA n=1 Tax=Tersicoccus solisilvae TaxID=1882339 RepID=A0ABQ1P430_9MICC|nr:glucose-6-phosphate dehydrogenase assembly protein OpcA [Tersicoccus solisilvae]GGC88539.1 glucose-6-phosphate dehydrogenase assembly protein OpcA [Tersicoccus solisilvae]
MIVDLPETTTTAVNKKLMDLRDEGGVVALGRVLTLVVLASEGTEEEAITAANAASREHPCRIIVHVPVENGGADEDANRMDAQIRVGGDAGAAEVVVLRCSGVLADPDEPLLAALLLPDAPIVAWWPRRPPVNAAASSIGAIAHRRITDSGNAADPRDALGRIGQTYTAGDTDLAWTRLTTWRLQLAAAVDEFIADGGDAGTVTGIRVEGAVDSPSTMLLAAWLSLRFGVEAMVGDQPPGLGIGLVEISTAGGSVVLSRPDTAIATLSMPGQADQQIALPKRSLQECLAEELRRLDPDEVFGEVVTEGLPLCHWE